MSGPTAIDLDFARLAPRPRKAGIALCMVGVLGCLVLGWGLQSGLAERNRLQASISVMVRPHHRTTAASARNAAAAAAIETQLWVPWSSLLAELEAASQDVAATVSLLEVEPDAVKHLVRITAEVRTLPDALAYLERLQRSSVLRYPMLDSHELRKDDPEHPIRIKLTAQWRT